MTERRAQLGSRRAPDSEPSEQLPVGEAAGTMNGVNADRAAADLARARYRGASMATLEPDEAIAALLCPHERLLAVRRNAVLELREPPVVSISDRYREGDLYLTSRRLVLLPRPVLDVELEWIEEIVLARNQLLLTLSDGSGVRLMVTGPRLLRVEISAARAQARRAQDADPPQASRRSS